MVKVIGVRFRTAGKIYFFSPGQFDIKRSCRRRCDPAVEISDQDCD